MVSVWVYYKNPNLKRVYEGSITFCIQDIWHTCLSPTCATSNVFQTVMLLASPY